MLESGGYMQKDEFKKYQEIVGTSEKEIMKLVNQSTYINIDKKAFAIQFLQNIKVEYGGL